MKNFLLLLCFGLLSQGLLAQKTFRNNLAYVQAVDGIPLRKAANTQGERLATLKNGEKITVGEPLASLTVEGVKGNWRKAKYGQVEGFVFDGFLSDLPPTNGTEFSSWDNFGISSEVLDQKTERRGDEGEILLSGLRYDNGVVVYYGGADCFSRTEWTFNNGKNIEEIFVWMRGCGGMQIHLKDLKLTDTKLVKRDAKGNVTQVALKHKEFNLKISYKGKAVVAEFENWCYVDVD